MRLSQRRRRFSHIGPGTWSRLALRNSMTISVGIQGRLVAEAVAAGDAEIAIQQTRVIQPVAGTEYRGPLPAGLIEYGRAGVGLLAVSQQRAVAAAFIKFMADPANTALIRKGDMEPPER